MSALVHRADRVAMRVIAAIAALGGLTVSGFGVARTVWITNGSGAVDLLVDAPMARSATAVGAEGWRYSVATGIEGIGNGARAMIASGVAVSSATALVVTAAVVMLFLVVASGTPFHRSIEIAALVSGCALAVGGLLALGLTGLGSFMAAADLEGSRADGVVQPAFPVDLSQVFAGFAILALVYVFRAGRRLQRDTEGLV